MSASLCHRGVKVVYPVNPNWYGKDTENCYGTVEKTPAPFQEKCCCVGVKLHNINFC